MLYGCRSPWLQGSLKRNDQADQMKPSLSVQQFSAALNRGCGSPRAGLREGGCVWFEEHSAHAERLLVQELK